jgi:hypothetical protein
MRTRTKRQTEANQLDLQMFRLAERINDFAKDCERPSERQALYAAAGQLRGNRYHVRQYMHRDDKEATNA